MHQLEARPQRPGSTLGSTIMSIMSYEGKCGLAGAVEVSGCRGTASAQERAATYADMKRLGTTMMRLMRLMSKRVCLRALVPCGLGCARVSG